MKIMEVIGYTEVIFAGLFCFLLLHHLMQNTLIPTWPVFGMLPSLALNVLKNRLLDWLTELLSKSGGTFLFKGPWFANMDMLVTSDPANIRHILNTNFSNYSRGPEFKEALEVLGDGIITADSDSWRAQRKLAHQLLHHPRFQTFLVQTTSTKIESGLIPVLAHVVENDLAIDLQDVLKRAMVDITMILLVGSDPGCLRIDQLSRKCSYVDALDDGEEVILYRHTVPKVWWKLQKMLGFGREKRHRDSLPCFEQLIALSITTKKEGRSRKEKKESGADLLTSYLEVDDVYRSKSDKFLRDTVMTFMGAGTSTVSAALTWFFWLVSQNPEVESKILEEIERKAIPFSFSPRGEKVKIFNMEGLTGLVYLHGALSETLRLFPSAPFTHKRPINPDVLPSGHRVDSKIRIIPMFYSVGRTEAVWGENCLEFKPERWITSDGESQYMPSHKFIAFGSGPRSCIGKEISFTQMRLIAATVLYNFHIESVEGHPICYKDSMVLYMKHGMKARIKSRF